MHASSPTSGSTTAPGLGVSLGSGGVGVTVGGASASAGAGGVDVSTGKNGVGVTLGRGGVGITAGGRTVVSAAPKPSTLPNPPKAPSVPVTSSGSSHRASTSNAHRSAPTSHVPPATASGSAGVAGVHSSSTKGIDLAGRELTVGTIHGTTTHAAATAKPHAAAAPHKHRTIGQLLLGSVTNTPPTSLLFVALVIACAAGVAGVVRFAGRR